MLSMLALLAILLIAGWLAYAATRPDFFRVSRATFVMAPPERIFPLINNLKSFNTWNPFMSFDPAVQVKYLGPDAGLGAAHEWSGNRNIGSGRIEIVKSRPNGEVGMKLNMLSPMRASNDVTFRLEPQGPATEVSWTMEGKNTFVSKLMSAFLCTEKMVGPTFEKGLADLKVLAEK